MAKLFKLSLYAAVASLLVAPLTVVWVIVLLILLLVQSSATSDFQPVASEPLHQQLVQVREAQEKVETPSISSFGLIGLEGTPEDVVTSMPILQEGILATATVQSANAPSAVVVEPGANIPVPVQNSVSEKAGSILFWPVVGPISSYMNSSHPLGIDIDLGSSYGVSVKAATSGTITFAGGDLCCHYGLYVTLISPDGIETLYAHLSEISVSESSEVGQGDIIAYSGCSGKCSGPHLHFEVIDNGFRVDPLTYLP